MRHWPRLPEFTAGRQRRGRVVLWAPRAEPQSAGRKRRDGQKSGPRKSSREAQVFVAPPSRRLWRGRPVRRAEGETPSGQLARCRRYFQGAV